MADRKAELERKKAKLQALREEKERRRIEKAQKDVSRTKLLLCIPEDNYITCSVRN
jgi:dynein intermediate chain